MKKDEYVSIVINGKTDIHLIVAEVNTGSGDSYDSCRCIVLKSNESSVPPGSAVRIYNWRNQKPDFLNNVKEGDPHV